MTQMKKIAIVLPHFGGGGAEKMVTQLAAKIDRKAFLTEIFCVCGEPLGNHMEQMLAHEGIRVHYIGKGLGFSISAIIRLYRALNTFRPDVIHTHLYACLYTFFWPLLHGKQFLHTFHLPPELENRRFLRRIISTLLIRAKVMVPVSISHQNQKFLCNYYHLPENDVAVVYNPVAYSKFQSPKAETSETFTFITAGRFSAQKNQKMMYHAFAAFLQKGYDARLVMLGTGEEEENLKDLARKLKISDQIKYAGFVSNVEDYLVNADTFLLSSDYEALPLALLEAMAAGLPIISTNVGGICDIVTDNGILIAPGDTAAMVQAMEQLYKDKALRTRMSTASKANARAYDVSHTAAAYSRLYSHYAGKNNADINEN